MKFDKLIRKSEILIHRDVVIEEQMYCFLKFHAKVLHCKRQSFELIPPLSG